jgi:nitrogen fixation/metabolism regulation signal transduction histidine kinase
LLISGTIFAIIANRDLRVAYFQAHLNIRSTLDILLPALFLVNLGGLVLGAVMSLIYTHRIAGPVYRLCRILKGIGQGNLAQMVKFRKSDELHELDDATTEMIVDLQNRLRSLQNISMELNRSVEVAVNSPDKENLNNVQNMVHSLENTLGAFQLPSNQ